MNAPHPIIKSDVPAIREPIPAAPAYGNIDPSSLVFTDDFAFIDTETTGIDPDVDAIVEIAVVRFRNGRPEVFHSLVNPGFPIPPTASAVHNIVDEDVQNAPTLAELAPKLKDFVSGAMRVAHNARFDALFVDPVLGEVPDASKWLCTWRLSRHVLPAAPSHGNNVLRYWLKTKPKSEGLGAHRAIDDVYVSLENMRHMLAVCQVEGLKSLDQVRAKANEAIIVSVLPFGKHVGKDFSEVPTDYFEWAMTNMADLDADLKASIQLEVARRPDRNAAAFTADGKPVEVVPAETMVFGKYSGRPLRDVPTDYFQFLLDKGVRMDPSTKLGVDQEMARRQAGAAPTAAAAPRANAQTASTPAPRASIPPSPPQASAAPAAEPTRRASLFGAKARQLADQAGNPETELAEGSGPPTALDGPATRSAPAPDPTPASQPERRRMRMG